MVFEGWLGIPHLDWQVAGRKCNPLGPSWPSEAPRPTQSDALPPTRPHLLECLLILTPYGLNEIHFYSNNHRGDHLYGSSFPHKTRTKKIKNRLNPFVLYKLLPVWSLKKTVKLFLDLELNDSWFLHVCKGVQLAFGLNCNSNLI